MFKALAQTVDIFLIYHHSDARSRHKSDEIMAAWASALPAGHVLPVAEPKACVDVMLGILAITSGSRTLAEYMGSAPPRPAPPSPVPAGG